jgi:hypothetical protein
MNLENLLKKLVFGTPVKGEPIGEPKTKTTIPGLTPRPTEKEWRKEFNVGREYSRFNPTGIWYGDETPQEYNNMLKAVLTGSI